MSTWIHIASFLQTKLEQGIRILHRIRVRIVLPIAHWGGRDMYLLTNGSWVDSSTHVSEQHILWKYNSEKHILILNENAETRLQRWPWLSVQLVPANTERTDENENEIENEKISSFFTSLRSTRGYELPIKNALMLYAHQKGSFITGKLHVTYRDGSEEELQVEEP
jgi:hypothetical protein